MFASSAESVCQRETALKADFYTLVSFSLQTEKGVMCH